MCDHDFCCGRFDLRYPQVQKPTYEKDKEEIQKMKRLMAIFTLAVIVLGLTSYSYACLNNGTKTSGYYGMAFVSVSATDNEIKSNTASVCATESRAREKQ